MIPAGQFVTEKLFFQPGVPELPEVPGDMHRCSNSGEDEREIPRTCAVRVPLKDAISITRANAKAFNYQVERIRRRGVRSLSGSPRPSYRKGAALWLI